jgi:hypothetical protein
MQDLFSCCPGSWCFTLNAVFGIGSNDGYLPISVQLNIIEHGRLLERHTLANGSYDYCILITRVRNVRKYFTFKEMTSCNGKTLLHNVIPTLCAKHHH